MERRRRHLDRRLATASRNAAGSSGSVTLPRPGDLGRIDDGDVPALGIQGGHDLGIGIVFERRHQRFHRGRLEVGQSLDGGQAHRRTALPIEGERCQTIQRPDAVGCVEEGADDVHRGDGDAGVEIRQRVDRGFERP